MRGMNNCSLQHCNINLSDSYFAQFSDVVIFKNTLLKFSAGAFLTLKAELDP